MPPNLSQTNLAEMAATLEVLQPIKDDEIPSSHSPTSTIIRNLSRDTLATLAAREAADTHVPVTCENQLRPLHCAAQQYAWGRKGSNSMVAHMKAAQAIQEQDESFSIDESAPYAELWLGTHPNGMSTVTVHRAMQHNHNVDCDVVAAAAAKQTLLEYVQSDPYLHCGRDEWTDLTFLFKVLSVQKVLSIQAHPDKKLAERLHADFPNMYKDPNHKPEMAIALSDQVQAMCGFRPVTEIAAHLEAYPELRALVGEEATSKVICLQHSPATRAVLQQMFKSFLHATKEQVQEQLTRLLDRLKVTDELNDVQKLMMQLAEQFPGDSGIMAPLFFNVITCQRGEALYISANEPHAYISGELLECMACSDNVVRAGLTPKAKDVETLVSMLTYKSEKPALQCGHVVDECTLRYEPPVADFCVEMIHVPPGQSYELRDIQSPSCLLTLSGTATLEQGDVTSLDVSFGSAAFASANTRATVFAGPDGVHLTRAFTNVYHDEFKYEGLEF